MELLRDGATFTLNFDINVMAFDFNASENITNITDVIDDDFAIKYTLSNTNTCSTEQLEKEQCLICHDVLNTAPILVTPCSHVFHHECIYTWLNTHMDCPICRQVFVIQLATKDMNTLVNQINNYEMIHKLLITKKKSVLYYCNGCGCNVSAMRYNYANSNYDLCGDCFSKCEDAVEIAKYVKHELSSCACLKMKLPEQLHDISVQNIALMNGEYNVKSTISIIDTLLENVVINAPTIKIVNCYIDGSIYLIGDKIQLSGTRVFTLLSDRLFKVTNTTTSIDLDLIYHCSKHIISPTIDIVGDSALTEILITSTTQILLDRTSTFLMTNQYNNLTRLCIINLKFYKLMVLPATLTTLILVNSVCETCEIDFLNNIKLEKIELRNMYVKKVSNLPEHLQYLTIINCRLECIENEFPITLIGMQLNNNKLNNIPSLMMLNNLKILSCVNNRLTAIDLPHGIVEVYVGHNKLTHIDISRCNQLKKFNCNNNMITHIDASNCSNLVELMCNRNKLKTLSKIQSSITSLDCSYNNLMDIYIASASTLHKLHCNNNKLRSITSDSVLKYMVIFNCANNSLIALPDINSRNLGLIICSKNKLCDISNILQEIMSLIYINCSHNTLLKLDIHRINKTIRINCSYNLLQNINFDNCACKLVLNCSNNPLNEVLPLNYMHLTSLNISHTPIKTVTFNAACFKLDLFKSKKCNLSNKIITYDTAKVPHEGYIATATVPQEGYIATATVPQEGYIATGTILFSNECIIKTIKL